MHKQTLAIATNGRGHRQLGGDEFEGEFMFLADLGIGPACRPVELQHPERAVVVAELIDAIFVAVEREQAPGRLETDAFRRGENGSGVQSVERRGCRMRHSHRRTLM